MDMVNSIIAQILGFSAKFSETLGMFFVPAVIFATIALVLFAKNSYKFLKIVLPLAGMVIGAITGASFIAPVLEKTFPIVGQYINPYYLAGIVLAVVLGVICFKHHIFAILLVGACSGYLFLGRIVKDLLLAIPFINQIANDVIRLKSYVVGVIICVITMIVFTFIVKRYFNKLYVFVTSLGVATATLGIAAVLLFGNTSFAAYAAIGGTVIGLITGMAFCYKQLGDVYLDY